MTPMFMCLPFLYFGEGQKCIWPVGNILFWINWQLHSLTCRMCSMETFSLHWRIGVECHKHGVAAGYDRVRHFGSAELAEAAGQYIVSIKYLHMVVRALLVRFQFKVVKYLEITVYSAEQLLLETSITLTEYSSDIFIHGHAITVINWRQSKNLKVISVFRDKQICQICQN